jgi:hypothetical protein
MFTSRSALIQVLRETHDAPASVQQRLTLAGDTNRYGEPNFHVVWGGSRLTWIGGRMPYSYHRRVVYCRWKGSLPGTASAASVGAARAGFVEAAFRPAIFRT